MDEGYSSVQPLNHKAKDTFFKKVYESPERLRGLAEFLLGRDADKVDIKNLSMERGVFVDSFHKQAACDMTVAEFSRDNMLVYQDREEAVSTNLD